MTRRETLEAEIERLKALDLVELRKLWARRLGAPVPKHQSVELLRSRLAYGLQVRAYGGLSDKTKRRLRQLHKAFQNDAEYTPSRTRDLKPGSALNREWKGEVHVVHVLDDGFEHRGHHYKSLSEVAMAITGSRWSGPQFFGFKGQ